MVSGCTWRALPRPGRPPTAFPETAKTAETTETAESETAETAETAYLSTVSFGH